MNGDPKGISFTALRGDKTTCYLRANPYGLIDCAVPSDAQFTWGAVSWYLSDALEKMNNGHTNTTGVFSLENIEKPRNFLRQGGADDIRYWGPWP